MTKNIVLLSSIVGLILAGCGDKTPTKSETAPIIASIDGQEVTTEEFDYVYKKNNSKNNDAYSKASIDEYLDLYTNFRLKVREAEELGYDSTNEFRNEFKDYERQLAEPYLTEKSVSDKLIEEAYNRSTEEINAAHILMLVKPEDTPEDTLKAYNKILEYRNMALTKKESFGTLAKRFSQDPSAKQNEGDLGYFTSMQMVYPFENGAYNTPVGEISTPVRTRFGYHIIHVKDRRKARGQVKVAHIMLRATEGMDEVDLKAAENSSKEIYTKLKNGASWNEMCKQFSEDASSAGKGGELSWFGTGSMPKEFENASFGIKENGEITEPIKTAYGYHIIKLVDKKGIETFEEAKPKLESKIARDTRSQLPKEAFIKRIKKENNFEEVSSSLDYIYSLANDKFLEPGWKYDENNENGDKKLFSISGINYSNNDFLKNIQEQLRPKKGATPIMVMKNLYKLYTEKLLVEYEKEHLADKYIDYKMLLKEYRDGILLFKLMDEKVWSKAVQDTSGLNKFYNENSSNYQWKERANTVIINAIDQTTLDKVKEDMKQEKFETFKFKINPIQFAYGKSNMEGATQIELDKIVGIMNADSKVTVTVTGYTESKGSTSSNKTLSLERAKAAKKYLVEKEIASNRITVKGLGETNFVAGNKKVEDRAKNNRVEFNLFTTSYRALEEKYNKENALTLKVKEGKFEKGDNPILNDVSFEKGETVLEKEGRKVLVIIEEILAPAPKTLKESRGLVISDFQNYLEKEWVKDLKLKYPVVVQQEEVNKLIKE